VVRGVNYFCRSCCLRRECYQRTGAAIETKGRLIALRFFFFLLSKYDGDRLWECGNLA
jgi:hypothetical protein